MGKFIKCLTGFGTAIGATPAAVTMATGDSKVLPFAPSVLLGVWPFTQVTGYVQIYSPKMHEANRAIQFPHIGAAEAIPRLNGAFAQRFDPGDELTIMLAGSAVTGDIESVTMNLLFKTPGPGGGRFISVLDLKTQGIHETSVNATITAATTGIYGGSTALSSFTGTCKSNTDYAVVGAYPTVSQGAICIMGPDTGNYRIVVPGPVTNTLVNQEYFIDISVQQGEGLIPVINSANFSGTFVSTVNNENGASPIVYLVLVQMPDGFVPRTV